VSRKLLRIRSEAQEEINAAFDWCFQRSPRAAEAFLLEMGRALAQILAHPRLYPHYTVNTRRRVLERFPYSVIFQEKDDLLLLVAVAHAKRRFDYWKGRL
jgi:toxin ParE1/3/4